MEKFLIVSKLDKIDEYLQIAKDNGLGLEINDFYMPDVLENEDLKNKMIDEYMSKELPKYCTMHGAFMDVSIFSYDSAIRRISRIRMRQSMEVAKKLGVKAVVFHTNVHPYLMGGEYEERAVNMTVSYMEELLKDYSDINIYLENMFDSSPDVIKKISDRLNKYGNYGVCLDYGHAIISGTDMRIWLDTLGTYIKHIHINDNNLAKDLHLAVGEGKIDWKTFAEYYVRYFEGHTILIETTEPERQKRSIGKLKEIGIISGRAIRHLHNSDEMLDVIFSYMNKIFETNEFSATVELLTDLGSSLVSADRASFWLCDQRNGQYWTLAAQNHSKITIQQGTGIVGMAIENNRKILCNDPYSDPNFNSEVDKNSGYVTRSMLCMPVTNTDGYVIGAFQVLNKINSYGEAVDFDERDVKRLSMIAAFCGKTLESYLLYNEAQIDQLTGLKNRRAFYEYYHRRILPDNNRDGVYLIMTDIDHFKRVNDTYGHNAGDAILRFVSDIFHTSLNADDEVVRWGGEEFIFILRGRNCNEAVEFAETLRKKIESTPHEFEGNIISITMSFGVNHFEIENTMEENIQVVDNKLYEAKKTGRNKVIY